VFQLCYRNQAVDFLMVSMGWSPAPSYRCVGALSVMTLALVDLFERAPHGPSRSDGREKSFSFISQTGPRGPIPLNHALIHSNSIGLGLEDQVSGK